MSGRSGVGDDGGAPSGDGDLVGAVLSFCDDTGPDLVHGGAALQQLTGYDADWFAADPGRFWQLFEPAERKRLRSFVASARSEPESMVVHGIHREGRGIRVELVLLPPVVSTSGTTSAGGLLIDASRGSESERTVARILGDVAVKLRGPIGALTVASTTLARSDVELSEEQRRSAMQIMDRSGRRLTALLVGMIELAHLRERPVAMPERVDVRELAEHVVRTGMGPSATRMEVTGDRSVVATVERASLERALIELIRNGLEHGGPNLAVHVGRAGGDVTVEVVDDGSGVPTEMARRLFEPFRTGHDDRGAAAGPGLGLPIALAAVQRSGGRLDHRPRQPSGAAFIIRIPTSNERRVPIASPPTVRVVVLGAQRLTADALAVGLEQVPRIAQAAAVTEMDAAESMVAQIRADVVLVDLDRTRNDALEESQRLRATFPSVRLVMIGTALTLRDLAAAADVGADGLVPKELGLTALADAVVRVLHETVLVDAATLLGLAREDVPGTRSDVLTDRESDVLQLLAQGHDVATISRQLGLQVSTCRGYVKSILAKLQAHSQLEAVVVASRLGLVRLPGVGP